MSKQRPVVAIVDDDPRLLESLEDLLESAGYVASQLLLGGIAARQRAVGPGRAHHRHRDAWHGRL